MAPSPGSSHPLRSCSLAAVASWLPPRAVRIRFAPAHSRLSPHIRKILHLALDASIKPVQSFTDARLVVYAQNKLPALNVWVQDEQLYVRGTT